MSKSGTANPGHPWQIRDTHKIHFAERNEPVLNPQNFYGCPKLAVNIPRQTDIRQGIAEHDLTLYKCMVRIGRGKLHGCPVFPPPYHSCESRNPVIKFSRKLWSPELMINCVGITASPKHPRHEPRIINNAGAVYRWPGSRTGPAALHAPVRRYQP